MRTSLWCLCHEETAALNRAIRLRSEYLAPFWWKDTYLIEPEDGRATCFPRTRDSKPDPVFYRDILGLAHSPDVTLIHRVFEDHTVVSIVHYANGA